MAKTFTFEEASAPSTFTFEEALGPAGGADAGLIQSARSAPMLYGEDPTTGPMQPQSSMPAGAQTASVAGGAPSVGMVDRAMAEGGQLRDEFFSGVDQGVASVKNVNVAMQANRLIETQARIKELEDRGRGNSAAANRLRQEVESLQSRLPRTAGIAAEANQTAARGSAMATREAVQRVGQAKTFSEAWERFKEAPYDVIAGVTAQSMPQMLPGLIAATLAGPVQGAIIMGASSGVTEFGSSLGDFARDAGVNTSDAQAVQAFYSDPAKLSEALTYAGKRAGIIGSMDAASGGIASKTIAPAIIRGKMGKQAVNVPTQMGVQAAMGGGGEAAAQIATKGEIEKPGEVFLEMAGELGGAPAEVMAFGREMATAKRAPDPTPTPSAEHMARDRGFLAPSVPDPVVTVQAATTVDGAITAAAQAVDAAFNERDRQQAKSKQAVSNIARILGTEIPDVGTAAAVPGMVEPAAGGGAPDGAPGVGAGVGTAGPAGQPVDTGGVGGQPAGGAVSLGAGQPGALNFAQPPGPVRQITVTPAGTLTAIGDPKALVRLLKSAGVTNVIPATNGITVGKSQASMARQVLDDFVAAPPENFEQDFQQELEREYQADIKAQLLAKRNPQPVKVEKKTQSPLRTMLRTVGIKPELAADITGERNKVRANNVLPFTFRKNGAQIDELVRIARERGFLTQDEDDVAAGRRLVEMIQADLRGERQESTETIEDAMRGEQDAEIARAAARLGLDTSGMDARQVGNAVNRIARRLEKARADGIRREAQAEARIEREAIQAADRRAAGPDRVLDDLDDVPENATLEDAMRALGFTEQEIADAVAQESRRAQADRAGSGGAVAPAAGPAQGGDRRGEGQARQEAGGAESRPQDLLGEVPNASQQAAARLRAEREEQDRRRQQAAPEAGGFMLSGSDRARDVGAAAGQGDLLAGADAAAAPGGDAGNGFRHGAKGERYRVGVVASVGGAIALEKRLPAGTAATFYVGKDGALVDGDTVNLIGSGLERLWIPPTEDAAAEATRILEAMGQLELSDPRRAELKAALKALVTGAADERNAEPDYLAELFGTPEQQAAAQAKFSADAEATKRGMARVREAIAEQKKRAATEYDEWAGKVYKQNKTQVDLRGDGPSNQASMSIGAINESRRRNAMEALSQEMRALDKLSDEVSTDSGAERVQAILSRLYEQAAKIAADGTGLFKTADEQFQYMLLDDLKFRGPSGKGNVTSNGLSMAMLAAIKPSTPAPAEPAPPEQQEGSMRRKPEGATITRAQESAIGNKGNFNRDKKDILLARSEPSLWYSELSRKIGEAKMNASNPEGWKAFLSGLPQKGVKPDEIEWSGIREWLGLQQGKVTKQQLLDYLDGNGVQVQEVVKGGTSANSRLDDLVVQADALGYVFDRDSFDDGDEYTGRAVIFQRRSDDATFTYMGGRRGWVLDDYPGSMDPSKIPMPDERLTAMAREIKDMTEDEQDGGTNDGTRYSQYTLPGGTNYREVLLTLPSKTVPGDLRSVDTIAREMFGRGMNTLSAQEQEMVRSRTRDDASANYRSNHWTEPNILAHIRLNDRTDAEGRRTLFVEELQSDWSQQARREGFKQQDTTAAERDALKARMSAIVDRRAEVRRNDDGSLTTEQQRAELASLTAELDRLGEQHSALTTGLTTGVPRAPFVDSTDKWLTLALKRIMVMAAQEGYDRVAFVNGEQSADRYSLSKSVDSINWQDLSSELRTVQIDMQGSAYGGDIGLKVNKSGVVEIVTSGPTDLKGKNLEDVIGKAAAEKIMAEPKGNLSGDGLKIGGEGMIAFYDKIVPAAVNKLLGKVGGGKVGDVTIGSSRLALREYPGGDGFVIYDEQTQEYYRGGSSGRTWVDYAQNAKAYLSEASANKAMAQIEGGAVGSEQPGFTITPDMREKLAGGMPLFGREAGVNEMNGASIPEVRAIVEDIRKTWKGGPSVEVVASYRDLPGRPVPRARGMYIGGKVYVVASSHRAGGNLRQAVAKTLSHEVIAHYGLRKILGADFDRLLTKPMQLAIASGNKPMTALREQVRRLYVDEDGNYTLSKRDEADEIAARAVENAIDAEGNFRPGYSWLKSVWARVAQFLRDMGIDVQFTQAELQGMLVQAQQAVRDGERLAGASTVVVTQQPVLSRRSAEDVAPAEGFWSKIKAGKSFTPQEIADAYARGVRGTVRAFAGFSGEKGGMAAVPGTEHAGWRDEIAGFDGYVTVGVSFADGSLAMGVIPRELYPGRGSALGLADLGEYSLATYAFTPNPDGSYRLDVFDPRRGGRVFDELARRGRLEETGDTDVAGQPYYRAVFDNRYTTSHSLIQEAVRRLGYHLGAVPTVVQIGRDTGSRANPGKEQVRTFTPEFIERRLARGEPRDTTAPVANPKDVAGNDSGRPAGDNPATEPDRTIESWRVDLAPALATAMRRWEAGRATDADLAAAVRAELDNRKAKREDATDRDRVRGSDWMQERILRARRTGQMSTAEADLALWLLNQAPQVATDLGISIKSGDMTKPNGTYNVLERVVTIFTSKSNPDTLTHEILHHTERMMPEPVQNAIRKEWLKQLEAESKKVRAGLERRIAKSEADPRLKQAVGTDQQRIVLLDWMLEAARKGDADLASSLYGGFRDGISLRNVLPYELSSPSEFWAVNAASLVRKRAETGTSLWRQARQWLVELMQKAKSLLGLRSNAPVIHGLEAVLAGDGSFVTRGMISTGARELNDQTDTPAFRRWFGESVVTDNGKPMSEGGKPLLVYHGTRRDISAFDGGRIKDRFPNSEGFYFTSSPRHASVYADSINNAVEGFNPNSRFIKPAADGGNVMPVYVSLQKPKILTVSEWGTLESRVDGDGGATVRAAREAGHDGVIVRRRAGDEYDGDLVIAFRPEQIKSAIGNNGEFDPANPDIRYALAADDDFDANPAPRPRSRWLDDAGRLRFLPGTIAYDLLGKAATPLLNRAYLKTQSKPLRRAIREMKLTVQKAQDTAEEIGREVVKLTDAEREMVSDIIEKELATGVIPPEHAVKLAATMNEVLGKQSDELVELGMLASDTAEQWRGKYLARYYKDKLGARVQSAWDKAISTFGAKPMRGLRGNHFKGRGLFEVIPEAELPAWEANGWEVRDPDYQEGITNDGTVRIWRDFTRAEREKMGEIRDAGFRFVMGYMETQKDIALGRMFQAIAADPELSSKYQTEELSEQVPDGTISGTGVKKYGKLAGRWVSKETISHLSQIEESQSEAFKMYRKAMGLWKETKTSLNPVAHVNNIVSNITMAHFAGVSYWDGHKYAKAMRDFATNSDAVKEAKDAGLFLGTVSDAELMNVLPEDLKAIVRQQEGALTKVGSNAFNAMTWFLRRPMGAAYQAEDTFFRYLIWKDARDQGMSAEDAVDYSLRYIFAYDDLPLRARQIRDFMIPFFAYTYKAIPALLHTALNYPWRFAAPAAVMWGVNAAAYAIAVGDDDDDWIERLQKYLTDPAYREKAKAREKLEREYLPEWMKGETIMNTPKAIRLGMDEVTKLPLFIDVYRMVPGGDMLDMNNNAGGVPWPQPLTISHPLFTTLEAMQNNKDSWRGKDIVDKTDDSTEAAQKRLGWMWRQVAPALAYGNYHFERSMQALANATGKPVKWAPDAMGGMEATGIAKDGLPVQPKYAAMQTFGLKVRPIDVEMGEIYDNAAKNKLIREIDAEMRRLGRLNAKGAVSDAAFDREAQKANVKRDRLNDGLTIDGKPKN